MKPRLKILIDGKKQALAKAHPKSRERLRLGLKALLVVRQLRRENRAHG